MSFHEQTEKLVKKACIHELAQAILEHGDKFNSMHEGYAVLKEEYEEARGAFSDIDLDFLWECVKRGAEVNVDTIQYSVIEAMKELAQVWAVCEKMKKGVEENVYL